MDYAANAINQNYSTGLSGQIAPTPVPQTIASASARLDGVNERLDKIIQSLGAVSSQLGALTPVGASAGSKPQSSPSGAVGRLNDAADMAHDRLSEVEHLVGGLQRALG